MFTLTPIQLTDIIKGNASHGGHVVYKNAIYKPNNQKIIYKCNKRNDSNCSRMEAALTGLARLFLQPQSLTSKQVLVEDEESISGLASEHMCYDVRAREGNNAKFYTIRNNAETSLKAKAYTTEALPIYFFNDFPRAFFAKLIANKELTLDMASLASVLATSYTLEEDDLHKGNFGFYIVKKNKKRQVVFFKIDHDLMMADSIMSRHYGHARITHIHHGKQAFSITRRDLHRFPQLISKNYYWPATRRYTVNPLDSRTYSSAREINAFIALNKNEEFNKAKWLIFYKHTLIPPALITQSLTAGYPVNSAETRAQNALVMNAVVARQAYLRAVLFSLPEFRKFINTLTPEQIIADILNEVSDEDMRKTIKDELNNTINFHTSLINAGEFVLGDTPLHAAIRLGDYRYRETLSHFSGFLNRPNAIGQRPIDLAGLKVLRQQQQQVIDVRANPLLIMRDLIEAGAKNTKFSKIIERISYRKIFITNYQESSPHTKAIAQAQSYEELLAGFGQIGEDYTLPLIMKKGLATYCLHQFMKNQRANPQFHAILRKFKEGLNGSPQQPPAPELQYVRQLRSELWIIRQLRGMLGGTSTKVAMNKIINMQLKQLANQPTFFTCREEEKEHQTAAQVVIPLTSQ